MKFNWRFETRVDTINLESLEILSEVGLKVIDLRLESASIEQIEKMGKSKNPQRYLEKEDLLIRKMYELGIWSKINILLYIGETNKTIAETVEWLTCQKKYAKGVSVNPLTVYLNGEDTSTYVDYIEHDTHLLVDKSTLYDKGYTFINLSNEIDILMSKKMTNIISDKFMTQKDFIELKNIGYTRRNK